MTDYGTDISTLVADDTGGVGLDPFFREIDGPRAVGECAIRGMVQSDGEFSDAPDELGGSVHLLLSKKIDQEGANQLRDRLFAVIMQDERVAGVPLLDVRLVGNPTRLKLGASIEPVEGETFDLVADIGALDVRLILPK